MSDPASRRSSTARHRTRILTALAIFSGALLVMWVGLPLLAPAFVIICFIAIQEYGAMMTLRGIPIRKRSLWVAAALTVPASLPATYPGLMTLAGGVSWREALLVVFAIYLLALEVVNPNRNSVHAVVFTLFGYLYIPFMFGYIITLRYTPDGVLGLWYLAIPLLAMVATDVGAYAFGTAFGRRKLVPRISPNKTLEGAVGGLVFALVIVAAVSVVARRLTGFELGVPLLVPFALLVSFAAQLGDLFESLLKRWAGIKDSGIFLPGHGGVLDRVDSALFTFPVSYMYVTLVILP